MKTEMSKLRVKLHKEDSNSDIYGLLGKLCEHLYHKHKQQPCIISDEDHSSTYLPQLDSEKQVRRLKVKAYEILLNKSSQDYSKEYKQCDPIMELLKHAFVLKVGAGRVSQAAELNRYLSEFIEEKLEPDSTTYLTLQFLNCLKSLDFKEDDSSLNIFYYDKPHPQLPEMICDEQGRTPFQVYPIESFFLPDKFEKSFRKHAGVIKYNAAKPGSRLTLLDRFSLSSNQHFKSRHNAILTDVPYCTNSLPGEINLALSSYFIPQIKDISESADERFQSSREGIVTYPESPWQPQNPLQWFTQNSIVSGDNQTKIYEIEDSSTKEQVMNWDKIWEEMDVDTPPPNYRTWETLGMFNPPKEPPFISESIGAIEHLMNIAQDIIIPEEIRSKHLRNEIKINEFISDVILLLLGVESSVFVYHKLTGFELKKNTCVRGIHCTTLESLCQDIIGWGTYFKNLSNMIVPDPQTGKLQVDGVIFEALCNSVKEFLLFYQAAILKVSEIKDEDVGILKFLHKVAPLGNLILRVAELCCCESQGTTSLGRGIGILTHIYNEVTKVTQQNVALVFYSILKDCCEVYFRFLQQWLFEGTCFDIYEEFIIKINPQYLRLCDHRFWTKGFYINNNSVPGFLSDLTEHILQCGKAVALLKICNPQHPLCRALASCRPSVRVCLSVSMLREQIKCCEEYKSKGKLKQNGDCFMYAAIQERKEAEKKRAELAIAAQQSTLHRLKKEREDALIKRAKEKNELLRQLKEQAEQVALRKEKDRKSELLADKLLIEEILKREEKVMKAERLERENTIKYYNDLAEEAERRRIHAEWRIRRMKLFDERVSAIASSRHEFINTPDESGPPSKYPQIITPEPKVECKQPVAETILNTKENTVMEEKAPVTEVVSKDENSNPKSAEEKLVENKLIDTLDEQNKNGNLPIKRAVRPTVLDLAGVNDRLDGLLSLRKTDNMTAAQRNKLKVLQHEYGITPNNNESATILMAMEKSSQTELRANRLRNTQHIAWDTDEVTKQTVTEESSEMQANRLKSTRHLNWNDTDITSVSQREHTLTEAKINRNKVMSHFYNRPEDTQVNNQVKSDKLTECQRNRNKNMAHSIEHFAFDSGREQESHFKETPMSTNTDQFTVSSSMPVPSFGDTPFSEITNNSDILFARSSSDGASTHEHGINKHFQDTPAFPNFIGFGSLPNTPSAETQQLTVADVEMLSATSLQVFLKRSVVVPLTVQSYLVNNAVIKYLLNEHNMLSHLHSLRSYFFLLNGEFSKTLLYSLFTRLYEVSQPAELFNSTTLTSFLEKALISSLSGTYANSELLSLSATEVPTYLQTSNPEILCCLSLNYKIKWPLNIIFNDTIIQQYKKVFKFLLMVGRVLWVLQEDFHILKIERNASITNNHHKLQLYRHSMVQFMNALQTYLTCSVLHASWSEFEKELENAKTIDEVNDTHVAYIKKILSRCMLNVRGEKMRTCLTNIFKVVLKFHNRIRAHNWNDLRSTGPIFENLEKMYEAFCEQRAYLAHVADKLTMSGYQPHLMQFLLALNINDRYDLKIIARHK